MRAIMIILAIALASPGASAQSTAKQVLDLFFTAAQGYVTYRGIKAILVDDRVRPATPVSPVITSPPATAAVASVAAAPARPKYIPQTMFESRALKNAMDPVLRQTLVQVSGVNATSQEFLDFKVQQADNVRRCLTDAQEALTNSVTNDPTLVDFIKEQKVAKIKVQLVDNSGGLLPSRDFAQEFFMSKEKVLVRYEYKKVMDYDEDNTKLGREWEFESQMFGEPFDCSGNTQNGRRSCDTEPGYKIYKRKIMRDQQVMTVPVQLHFDVEDNLICGLPAPMVSTTVMAKSTAAPTVEPVVAPSVTDQ